MTHSPKTPQPADPVLVEKTIPRADSVAAASKHAADETAVGGVGTGGAPVDATPVRGLGVQGNGADESLPLHAVAGAVPSGLQPLDEALMAELPTFELFFKTFGFKRMHGRIWGLLVLSETSLSSKDIASQLSISAGATSTTLNELAEWGAVRSSFDSSRRCHLHSPVGNALSIVATVFRRREQVVFQQFRQAAHRALAVITAKNGERDPRVLTLRSIITTCDIGEALMQLVFSAVQNAMTDSESLLSRAIQAAFKVGVGTPTRWFMGDALNSLMSPQPLMGQQGSVGPQDPMSPQGSPLEPSPLEASPLQPSPLEQTSGAAADIDPQRDSE